VLIPQAAAPVAVCEVHGYHKQGAAYGYTHTLGYHPLLATRADIGEVLHARQRTGRANTARGAARVRRAGHPPGRRPGRAVPQLALPRLCHRPSRHHGRAGPRSPPPRHGRAVHPRPQSRRGLRHCPSGKFAANAAWLVIATLAHNLLRWIAQIGLGAHGELVVAKTLRRTLLALPGRITRSARRLVLHLPVGWPWAAWFEPALARLRCVAYAT
jgi:hypothetical protein